MTSRTSIQGDVCYATIGYPRCEGDQFRTVEVGLCDVRASDSVRVHYDFERDGWVISQASTFSWPSTDEVCDSDWQEVAFARAWQRLKEDENDQGD